MKGQALGPMKWREERKNPSLPRSENQREFSGKNWAGIPKDCQGVKILGTCNTTRMRLRQLKKSTKKHKERKIDTSFLITQRCRKEPEGLESNNL